jgi:hypothetical protein
MKDGVLSQTDRDLACDSGRSDNDIHQGYVSEKLIKFGVCQSVEVFVRRQKDNPQVEFTYLVDLDLFGRNMMIGVANEVDMLDLMAKITPYISICLQSLGFIT